jgi:hypothetical protein
VILTITPNLVDPNYRKLREPLRYELPVIWEAYCAAANVVYARLTLVTLPDPVRDASTEQCSRTGGTHVPPGTEMSERQSD